MILRVLVTGSRQHATPDLVEHDLWELFRDEQLTCMTLVHGAEDSGIDAAVHRFVLALQPWTPFMRRDLLEERHDAPWVTEGTRAWEARNDELIRLGADMCLVYLQPPDTACALDLVAKAQTAGIMTISR